MKKNEGKFAEILKSENKVVLYAAAALGFVSLVLLILLLQVYQGKNVIASKVKSQAEHIKKLETPVYDSVNDFLTDQCETKGTYCISTETSSPSVEILKFLVNFRETPGYSYRLFFEVSVGQKGDQFPYQLKCGGADTEFYVCQEITATRPTDVIRVFEPSFRTLSKNATYQFNLMVKPVGEIQHTDTISMVPNPNLKVVNNIENLSADKTKQEEVKSESEIQLKSNQDDMPEQTQKVATPN